MKQLALLLILLFFTACDSKINTNTATTSMTDMPEDTQNFVFSFKDGLLYEYNSSSNYDLVTSKINYIDETHIEIVETITDKGAPKDLAPTTSTRHLLLNKKGDLIELKTQDPLNKDIEVTTTYIYDEKGHVTQKKTSDQSGDLRYETDTKGKIIKEIYEDNTGYNLFIYKGEKLSAINFFDEEGQYLGAMVFKEPIDLKSLMLLE